MFHKISGSEKVMDKREGEVSRFLSKSFCLTVPKNAVGELFSLSLVSGIEEVWMRGWGGSVKIFRGNILFSQCRKISYCNPLGCH